MSEQTEDVAMEGYGVTQILQKLLEEDNLGIPGSRTLPNGSSEVPFVFLRDDAFALKPYLMKTIPTEVQLWRNVFTTTDTAGHVEYPKACLGSFLTDGDYSEHQFYCHQSQLKTIVMTILVLNNYLRQSLSLSIYCPPGLSDVELPTREYLAGEWCMMN